jgi:late competence protein required for DNA uptake (superfamily II DNA/RNA helicase)
MRIPKKKEKKNNKKKTAKLIHVTPKERCHECNTILQNAYGKEKKTQVIVGKYCPNCDYIRRKRKDKH